MAKLKYKEDPKLSWSDRIIAFRMFVGDNYLNVDSEVVIVDGENHSVMTVYQYVDYLRANIINELNRSEPDDELERLPYPSISKED